MGQKVVEKRWCAHHEGDHRFQGHDAGGTRPNVDEGLELPDQVPRPQDHEDDVSTIHGVDRDLGPALEHDAYRVARVALSHDPCPALVPLDAGNLADGSPIAFVQQLEKPGWRHLGRRHNRRILPRAEPEATRLTHLGLSARPREATLGASFGDPRSATGESRPCTRSIDPSRPWQCSLRSCPSPPSRRQARTTRSTSTRRAPRTSPSRSATSAPSSTPTSNGSRPAPTSTT